MSRILFLDIDGVLNSSSFFQKMHEENKPYTDQTLDGNAVKLLESIVQTANCDVVISSSWRLCNSKREIGDILWRYGFRGTILDMTPDISLFDRKAEILAWIKDHPEATSFCALDDNPIKLPFWIEVDPKLGLYDEYYIDLVLNCFQRQENKHG